MSKPSSQTRIVLLILAVITAAAYYRSLGNLYVSFDDGEYVVANQHIQSGVTLKSLAWAFTTGHAGNWHPLTWISHMADYQVWGMNPFGHHLTSLLFHTANTLLLFLVLTRITGGMWRSAFAAALFGVHPLHVESVAWVAERKDVLSAFFFLLTIWAYHRYTLHPKIGRYILVALLFALGLMAKPMLVTLPLLLILLDYWPLKRLAWKTVAEKVPLLVLAIGSCIVTYVVHNSAGAVNTLGRLPFGIRMANAAVAGIGYISKMLWPQKLAIFYPHPLDTLPVWMVIGSVIALLAITALVVYGSRRHPYLLAGWLWYIITMIPVIGIVQVGSQAMADRYTYIPYIGLFIMIAWLIPELPPVRRFATASSALAGAMIVVLTALSWVQVGCWHDSITLYKHACDVTKNNWLALNNLGDAQIQAAQFEEAEKNFRKLIRMRPKLAEAHLGLAASLLNQGRWKESIAECNVAMELDPNLKQTQAILDSALECSNPSHPPTKLETRLFKAYMARAVMSYNEGKLDDAVYEYGKAISFNPHPEEAHFSLAVALKDKGDLDGAIREYKEVIRIKPDMEKAHNNLAIALYYKGDYAEAWKEVRLTKKHGGSPHPGFLQSLSEKIPEPQE